MQKLTATFAPLALALAVSIAMLSHLSRSETNFENFALGETAVAHYATIGDTLIHCKGTQDAEDCLEGARERGKPKLAVWLGNSQLHGINHYKQGDTSAPKILFEHMQSVDADLLTFSQPNANLQEHYVLFEFLKNSSKIDFLVLPVVFDDTREDHLRRDSEIALDIPSVRSEVAKTAIGRRILKKISSDDLKGLALTVQEHTEAFLNKWVARASRIWKNRVELRGRFMTNLYLLRNSVFGITPQSKRKLLLPRYRENMEALEAILQTASGANIKVILYIPPLRNDVEVPYVLSEYNQFKSDLKALSSEYRTALFDLENVVPGQFWGLKPGTNKFGKKTEIDFMHFTSSGHALLAEALWAAIYPLLGAGK